MRDFFIDTGVLPQTFFSFELEEEKEYKIKAVILMQEKLKKIYSCDLMGQKCVNWVKSALKDYKTSELWVKNEENYLPELKKMNLDCDFVVVLHADTPLITRETLRDAVSYATTKNLDFCKLYRGAIFKVEALKKQVFEYSAEANFLEKGEFFALFNNETISYARNELKNRIINFHLKNGVDFADKNSVYIEKNVDIARGVKIGFNNVLKGYTKIKKGCVLEGNNVLENCKIGENCEIICSVLKNCEIKDNEKVKPFTFKMGEKK